MHLHGLRGAGAFGAALATLVASACAAEGGAVTSAPLTPQPVAIERTPTAPASGAAQPLFAGAGAPTPARDVITAPAPTAPASPAEPAAPLTATAPAAAPTPDRAGARYAFPISPPSQGFFDHVVNGHGYPATDIFAEHGTPVVSVAAGIVGFLNRADAWSDPPDDGAARGGVYLSVVGDDGLQYYFSHLADIRADLAPGVRVEAGELLGHVGTTGNARSTPPHLHFGMSCPTTPEQWELRRGAFDPLPYIVAWSSGDAAASPAGAYAEQCAGTP